jgi:diguanylate cyclase (GGDEF)-like protein
MTVTLGRRGTLNVPMALDHIAELTRSRDRERVDASLLTALLDLLPTVRQVVIWRVLGEPGTQQYWLRSGMQARGDLVPATDRQLSDQGEPAEFGSRVGHARCFTEVLMLTEHLPDGLRVLLPMASDREIEGVVELWLDAPLDTQGERLARSVLKIHRNFLSLLEYSERDTLTGLLNRKGFDETFFKATAIEAAQVGISEGDQRRHAGSRHHYIGVIDIDHFKRVNDDYGHLIGDEVLVLVARIMRSTFRYDDRLYRFGGEEFVVLLTALDDAGAGVAFERLRVNLESFVFPRAGRVTISVGYSDVRPGDTPQAAFNRADKAVYYGKENGRNRVCSHLLLVAAGALSESSDSNDVELF